MTRRLAVYADGPDGPLIDPVLIGGVTDVLLGWVVRTPAWLPSPVRCTTLVVGAGLRRAVSSGAVRFLPTRLSAVPGLLAGRLRPDLAVVGAGVDSAGRWRLVGSPGYAAAAVAAAPDAVIERWPRGTAPLGEPLPASAKVVSVFDRVDPPDAPPANTVTDAHRTIGRLVAALVPEGATLQWGPGAIGASVVAALDRPVRVRSGLVTDELVDLDRRGLLAGPAAAAYVWGGPELAAMVAGGRFELKPISWTHDLTTLSATHRFVAVNTALQVGLDGAANVEVAGGRVITGPGGHPDFAAGAARSPGGLSIVALPATAAGRSTIVRTPEVVSTPRCDIDVVVTEHGVADLRGLSPTERGRALLSVAAPEFRAALA